MTHHQCHNEKNKYSDTRKVHKNRSISLGEFFGPSNVEVGDRVIIEEKGPGRWEIIAAKVEKRIY